MKKRVLFICTGNSARSQMAEVLLRHKAGDQFEVFSAGTQPESVDPLAINALSNFGLSVGSLSAKPLSQFDGQYFDYVITLCAKASAECKTFANAGKQLAWDFPDPKSRQCAAPYAVTLNELSNRIGMFLLVEAKAEQAKAQSNPPLRDTSAAMQFEAVSQLSAEQLAEQSGVIALDPLTFYKCFTDELRLNMLMLINYYGELCVCELMHALNEPMQPKVSRNLAILRKAQLLQDHKRGQWVFYQLNTALPQWCKTVIAETTEGNANRLVDFISRLDTMKGRPDKSHCC